MKRIMMALALVGALIAAVPASSSPLATNTVAFSSDSRSATLNSTKGISHYEYTLCDGTTNKVELSGEEQRVVIGPFDAEIVSVTVKAGRSRDTFASGFSGECGKPQPDPDPK